MARTKRAPTPPGKALAIEIARLAHDRHCQDIRVLDLRQVSPVTDYFVIATGTSDRQMRSLADEIIDMAAGRGDKALGTAGLDMSQWILLDFVDVVVHLFDQQRRDFYDLELIWGDAPRVTWRKRRAKPAPETDEP